MNNTKWMTSTIALLLGSTLAFAADPMGQGQQPGQTVPSAAAPTDPMAPIQESFDAAPQRPPEGWSSIKGTVESIDAQAKTVQIKDELGQSFQVPVDSAVKIQKDGKAVKLSQIKTGDRVSLAKKSSGSTSGASGTQSY